MEGWIKLHRQLTEWEWYSDINTSRLFVHLLLTANHKDGKWRGIAIKRGSRLTSLDKLSVETNLSVSKIRTSIKKLISTNEIASKSHSQHTVFTVINYDSYQVNDKQNDKPMTNESQTNDKRIATNKNEENVNNDKNKDIADKNIVDRFERLWAHYERKGNKKTSMAKFKKINPDEPLYKEIWSHVTRYKAANIDNQFRKDFQTYLNQEAWNDVISVGGIKGSPRPTSKPFPGT